MEDSHILAILSAILLSLAFPKFNLWFIAYIALIPFFIELDRAKNNSYKKMAFLGVLFGLPFMLIQHSCLLELKAFSTPLLIQIAWLSYGFILSFFWALFAVLYKYFNFKKLLIPFIWVCIEYLKSIGIFGNTVGSIANSQVENLAIAQLSWLGGPYLISFFVVTINIFLYCAFAKLKEGKRKGSFYLVTYPIVLFLTVLILGNLKINYYSDLKLNQKSSIPIAIIQANHKQSYKLKFKNRHKIRNDYIKLSQEAIQTHQAKLIVFPETISPSLNLNDHNFIGKLQQLSKNNETAIILGTPRLDKENQSFFNSVSLIESNKALKQHYDKIKLFPFGEYWPFKRTTKWLGLGSFIPEEDFTPAQHKKLLTIDDLNLKIAPAIYLESMYTWHFNNHVFNNANLLVVIANHAWFKNSSAAKQHLNQSVLRAIENNRYLIQAANTGISAVISPNGLLLSKSNLNTKKIIYGYVQEKTNLTPFSKLGNCIVYISFLLLLLSRFRFFNYFLVKFFKYKIR